MKTHALKKGNLYSYKDSFLFDGEMDRCSKKEILNNIFLSVQKHPE